jgi:mxaL protein
MRLRERIFDFRLWCLVFSALLVSVALLNPKVHTKKSTYSFFVVFDITQSQNAEDMVLEGRAVSRLAFAKHVMRETLRDMPCGSSLGIGLFASAELVPLFKPIEVCRNFSEIDKVIEAIDWRMAWNDSSQVAFALYSAIARVKDWGLHKQTRVVFLSDGDETGSYAIPSEGFYVDSPAAVDTPPPFTLKKGEVRGLIVGVGGLVPAPIPRFDEFGKRAGFLSSQSRLDEKYLKKLAAETGLEYVRLESARQLSSVLKSQMFGELREAEIDIRLPLATAALFFLLLGVLL